MKTFRLEEYVDAEKLVTGILVGLLTTIIVSFFRSGESLYKSVIFIFLVFVLGYLLFSKRDSKNFDIFPFIGKIWVRIVIFFGLSILLFVFIFDINLNLEKKRKPEFDVVSAVAFPDSAVVIRGKNVNRNSRLDVKFNGIEFRDAADPIGKREDNLWEFNPHNRENIPSGLVDYGEALIEVGVDGNYYTKQIKIYIDSTIDKDSSWREIKIEKGWNLSSFNVRDSIRVDQLIGSIDSSPILMIKDEAGRVYREDAEVNTLEYVAPNK